MCRVSVVWVSDSTVKRAGPARPAPARYGPRAKRAGPFRPVFKRAKFFKPKPAHLAGGPGRPAGLNIFTCKFS